MEHEPPSFGCQSTSRPPWPIHKQRFQVGDLQVDTTGPNFALLGAWQQSRSLEQPAQGTRPSIPGMPSVRAPRC